MRQATWMKPPGKSKRLTWAALTSAIMLFAFASMAPAASQNSWALPASNLSVADQNANVPEIAVAPDGTTTAVWQRFYGSNLIIQTATRPPGGSFGAAVNLSATGQNADQPQIAIAPDGTATAVWTRFDGANYVVQAVTRPPGGTFGATVDLSAAGENASRPRIAIAPDGATTVVWIRYNGVNYVVQAATRPPGGSFGAVVELSAAGAVPQVAIAPDGATTVVWIRYNGVNNVVQAVTRPPGGTFGAAVDLSAAGGSADQPQIAIAPDGTATAVWYRSDGSNNIIQAATRPPGGSFGAATDVSAVGQDTSDPQIVVTPDGTATAVWSRYDAVNYIYINQAATRPPGGSFGAAVDLSAAGQDARLPQIAVAPDGTATAVWARSDGADYIIEAATRQPGGSFAAAIGLSAAGQTAYDPQIAIAADGTATTVWSRSNGTKNVIQSASTGQPSILLQVDRAGSGAGAVSSSPAGISCGADCAEVYPSFTTVTLTATPSPGSTFTGWSGAGCSGIGTCEVTLLEATAVTAEFTADPPPPGPDGTPRLANLKITPKSKSAKPGSKITFKVRVTNTGLVIARNLKVCAKAPKRLVKPIRCARVGSLAAGQSRTVKIVATVKRGAKKGNRARLTFTATATGVSKKTGRASLRVR